MNLAVRRRAGVAAIVVVAAAAAIILAAVVMSDSETSGSHPAGTHVILVSVDGLRPDAVTLLGPDELPNLYRLRTEGAFTDNARNDLTHTVTLPNHTAMLSGRNASGAAGHGVTINDDDGGVIHGRNPAVPYVTSIFDVVHDRDGSTSMYVSKTKLDLLNRSWDGANGAPDTIDDDDGRDKVDTHVFNANATDLMGDFVNDMETNPYWFSLVHLQAPDEAGHANGWMSVPYLDAVRSIDTTIGTLLDFVATDEGLTGNTVVIVTSDHGGTGLNHDVATAPENYTIPLYVWGKGVSAGDLYDLNPSSRLDPATARPAPEASPPPIRNGDVANLALGLLGLPPVPGSVLNGGQDLSVTGPSIATTIAATNPGTGRWQLLQTSGGTASFYFGLPGDTPILGDWDCDGSVTPGTYRRSSGKVLLTNTTVTGVAELDYFFGGPGDTPIVGDWNGDDCDTVAVYRRGRAFITNALSTGPAEFSFLFGTPGDKPFAGDFDGSGTDSLGVHRPTNGRIFLRNLLTTGPGEVDFSYGNPSDQIIAADWDGDGDDTVGAYRPGEGRFYLSNENREQVADIILDYGEPGWLPTAGSGSG